MTRVRLRRKRHLPSHRDQSGEFMYGQMQEKDLKLFVDISDETYDSYDDVPMTTLIPAFILSELRTAFIIGFVDLYSVYRN